MKGKDNFLFREDELSILYASLYASDFIRLLVLFKMLDESLCFSLKKPPSKCNIHWEAANFNI